MSRTFVIGLDGASWRLLSPWIEAGDLPNIASLKSSGTWATSHSCLPPVTFPNWKCYSSGKNPGGFGVYWFERINIENETVEIMSGRNFKTAELWDYLNEAEYSTGVVNMPTMYPPRNIDGPVVCGGPDAVDGEYRSIDSGYTSPAELEERLERDHDYRVHPNPLLSSNEEDGAEVGEILTLIDKRFEVALELFEEEELNFVHVTLFYLNVLQHFFWNDDPTKRAWKLADEWIGRIADLEDTNVVLMSDHGCAQTTTEFYINEWLAENGYLTERTSIEDYLSTVGLNRENVLSAAKQAGVVELLVRVVPERIQKLVPQSAGVKRERKLEKIDLDRTRAVASGQGPIYINDTFDVEATREELIRDLKTVTDDQGEPLFVDVYSVEEVYSGPYTDIGPDIVIDQRPGVHVNDGLGGGEVQTSPDRWAAENTPYGIFVAHGPDFESNSRIDDISITDIAPTLLAAYGVARPTDMDGDVLPILADEPPSETRSSIGNVREDQKEQHEEVADRLKQLGYME